MSVVAADLAELRVGPGSLVSGLRRYRLSLDRPSGDASAVGEPWGRATALQRPARAELRAEGLFVSGEAAGLIREAFTDGTPCAFSLFLPGDGTWSGDFIVRDLVLNGRSEGEVGFSLRIVSAGPVTFTPQTEPS